MRVLLFKADEGKKISVKEVRERLDELMGDRPYKVFTDEEGYLTISSGSIKDLTFSDTDEGVGVFVVWDLGEDEDSTYEVCRTWEELKEFVDWAISVVEWGRPFFAE
jgi:hypothetical protein